jgi:hypothetical protein
MKEGQFFYRTPERGGSEQQKKEQKINIENISSFKELLEYLKRGDSVILYRGERKRSVEEREIEKREWEEDPFAEFLEGVRGTFFSNLPSRMLSLYCAPSLLEALYWGGAVKKVTIKLTEMGMQELEEGKFPIWWGHIEPYDRFIDGLRVGQKGLKPLLEELKRLQNDETTQKAIQEKLALISTEISDEDIRNIMEDIVAILQNSGYTESFAINFSHAIEVFTSEVKGRKESQIPFKRTKEEILTEILITQNPVFFEIQEETITPEEVGRLFSFIRSVLIKNTSSPYRSYSGIKELIDDLDFKEGKVKVISSDITGYQKGLANILRKLKDALPENPEERIKCIELAIGELDPHLDAESFLRDFAGYLERDETGEIKLMDREKYGDNYRKKLGFMFRILTRGKSDEEIEREIDREYEIDKFYYELFKDLGVLEALYKRERPENSSPK